MSQEPNIVYLFFAKPWIFWIRMLSTSSGGAKIGFAVIAIILALIWYFLYGWHYWVATTAFLIWVGPVILFTPLLLYLISKHDKESD
jgi:hypothetical protein